MTHYAKDAYGVEHAVWPAAQYWARVSMRRRMSRAMREMACDVWTARFLKRAEREKRVDPQHAAFLVRVTENAMRAGWEPTHIRERMRHV